MSVIIPKKVYLTVVAAGVRFANAKIDKDDWLEVSGVFVGKNEGKKKNSTVIVSGAYPIMHQELDKDAVIDQYKWSDEDYEALYLIDDEAFSRDEFVVGWWHTHPGFKVMMSHIDIRTTLSYQTNNPLAISLVFNPQRLAKQTGVPDKKGDPEIKLKNDPGFKIYRLDDVSRGVQASYHEVDYDIQGFESMEQLVSQMNRFIRDLTTSFPKEKIVDVYQKLVSDKVNELNALVLGTDEYLKTLIRQGEASRVPEVLDNQKKDIRKYIAETFMRIENVKEYLDYLEYKEKQTIIPAITQVLNQWDDSVGKIDATLTELTKKY